MKRILRWCGVAVVMLLGLLSVAYALRSVLVAPWLARELVAAVEQQTGLGLRVGVVGGSYLTSLSLADVRTVRPASRGPVRRVEAREMQVSYRLVALFSGAEAFLASVTVDLSGAYLEVDLGAEPVEDGAAPSGSAGGGPPPLPGVLPTVRVRDTSVLLRGPDYRVELGGISLDVAPDRGAPTPIRIAVTELTWDHPAVQPGRASLAAELEYVPEQLLLRSLAVDGRPLAEQVRVGLAELPHALAVSGGLRVFNGEAGFSARVAEDQLDASLNLRGVELEQALGMLRTPLPSAGGRLSADASLLLPWQHPEALTASLSAQLEGGRWQGTVVETVTLDATAGDGRLRVARLGAGAGANRAEVRDAEVPLAALLAGELPALLSAGRGEFTADLQDLPALLRVAGSEATVTTRPEHRVSLTEGVRDGRLAIGQLHAVTPGNQIELRDLEAPLEALVAVDLNALVRSSQGWFQVELRDLPALAALVGVSSAVGTGGAAPPVPGHHLVLAGSASGGVVEVAEGRLVAEGAQISLERARLDLSASAAQDWSAAGLEAQLVAVVPDLGALAALIGGAGLTGSLHGTASLDGTIGAPQGELRISGQNLAWRDLPLGAASLEAVADRQRIEVRSLVVERGTDRLAGRGTWHPEQARVHGVDLEVSVGDLAYYTRTWVPQLPLSGGQVSARLEASGYLTDPTLHLSLQAGSGSLSGLALDQVDLLADVAGGSVRVGQLTLATGAGELELSGTATLPDAAGAFQLVLESLQLRRQGLELALQTPARIAGHTSGRATLDSLALAGPVGSLQLRGSYDPQGELDLSLEVEELSGDGWLEDLVGERAAFRGADLQVRLTGTAAQPLLSATSVVEVLHLEGAPFPLRGYLDLGYGPGGIALRRLGLQGDLGTGLSAHGAIPYDPLAADPLLPGPLSLQVVADVPSLGPLTALFVPDLGIDGYLKGTVELQGDWNAPHGEVRVEGQRLVLPPAWRPQPATPLAVSCVLLVDGDQFNLETLRVRSTDLEASATGTWSGAPSLAQALRGELGDLGGTVALHGQVDVLDLAWVAADLEAVRRLGGGARGEITVEGPLFDPLVRAVLELADAELLINGPTPGIRAVSGRISADRSTARLERISGELGGAPFQISGEVERRVDSGIHVGLQLQGDDLLLFRNDGVKLRADTALHVAGELEALEISGTLAITDGRFVKSVDFLSLLQGTSAPKASGGLQLFSFPDPPLRDARLDLAITAKAPFRIKNNLVRGGLRPDLRITGSGEIPVLNGKLYVEPTRLSLPAGRLLVESGIVTFPSSDPDRPRLDLLATAKMIGYDITMQVEGPYDVPVVTLSSTPPLSHEDLLLLVFAGVVPRTAADEGTAQQSGLMMATYLGRTMLKQAWGDESTEAGESILDRFDLVVGQGVTHKGEETIEASFRLKENLLGEADTLYLRSEKDVYDAYNAGVRIVFRFR